jgi:hypothetical protein
MYPKRVPKRSSTAEGPKLNYYEGFSKGFFGPGVWSRIGTPKQLWIHVVVESKITRNSQNFPHVLYVCTVNFL